MDCKAYGMSAHGYTGKGRGRGGRREDLDNRYFRSLWEANWARYLRWMKERNEIKDWQYEAQTFQFEGIKRGSRFYTPDFKVTKNDGAIEFLELKGYMDQASATKLKRMAKYFPEVKIVLIQRREYDEVKKGLCKIIPNWEYEMHYGTGS